MNQNDRYLNDAVLVNIVEHVVHNGGNDLLGTTGDGQSDGGGVKIAWKGLSGEDGFSLEEIPFSIVLDKGNKASDGGKRFISGVGGRGRMKGNTYGSHVASSMSN